MRPSFGRYPARPECGGWASGRGVGARERESRSREVIGGAIEVREKRGAVFREGCGHISNCTGESIEGHENTAGASRVNIDGRSQQVWKADGRFLLSSVAGRHRKIEWQMQVNRQGGRCRNHRARKTDR